MARQKAGRSSGFREVTRLRSTTGRRRLLYASIEHLISLAPFLLVGILLAASDNTLMRGQRSSFLGRAVVGFTTLAMFAAGIAMFVV